MQPRVSLVPSSVRKICQLTGERDRERGTPAFNQTETNFGFFGTDLGSSFEHGGRLWFLFGDTWPGPGPATDSDCVAWTTDTNPEPGIQLHFVTGAPRQYKSPVLRDRNGQVLSTGGFETPIAGISAGGRMYVFYSTDAFEEKGGDGGLDGFWFGTDGSVGTAWANPTVDSGKWHPPFQATPPGVARAGSPIAAVTRFDDALDVFWIGPDGAVGTTWANPQVEGGGWHAPFPISPPRIAGQASFLAALTRRSGGARTLIGRTVLASAENDDPTDLGALYDVSRLDQDGKFINIACAVASNGIDGLPGGGPFLLAWGSGRYRDSDVFLGAIPLNEITDPAAWRFFTGVTGAPWTTDQRVAAPLFLHREVGELSVSWVEPLGLWLMLYNAATPRGIVGRVAEHPWGPWSDTFLVFDPGWPGLGYGHFMHVKDGADKVSDPGREHEWGGEYGPYLIDRYTRAVNTESGEMRQARIYFVMSTWNPYNTVLMTATVQREQDG